MAPLKGYGSGDLVEALASLPDGSVLARGNLWKWNDEFCHSLIKLHPSGQWDRSFVHPYTSVGDLHSLPDGRILVATSYGFTSVAMRLLANGSPDPTWQPAGGHIEGRNLLPLPDGRTILASDSIMRLMPDGTVDPSFTIHPESAQTLALQKDGKILASGYFHQLGSLGFRYLIRLYPDGALDTSFTPDVNSDVWEIEVQRDGRILIAGGFTQIEGQAQKYAARLNSDGSFDASFRPQSFEWHHDFKERPDGVIVAAGGLEVGHDFRTLLGLIHPDGSVDADWSMPFNAAVNAAATQPDSLVVFGTSSDISEERLVRLKKDGTRDASLSCVIGGVGIDAVLVLADGDMIIGGSFHTVNGDDRDHLARISPTGALRPGFDGAFNNAVKVLRLLADGRILVAGEFTEHEGTARPHVTRLLADGTLDLSFAASTNGPIDALSLLPDGRIYAAGRFTQCGSLSVAGLARLSTSGAVDTAFTPSISGIVKSVFALEDGGCLICGDFTQVNGQAMPGIARLDGNGSLDMSLNPRVNMQSRAIHQRPDGAI
ncbi:MAG: hypothetical protein ABL974_19460, partial [Prosthecobacter sp.]